MIMPTIAERARPKSLQRPHILLVEDEINVAKGLEVILSEEGYDVDLAMTGLSALKMFRGNGFDLVIADLRLPDIDGMDVLQQVSDERHGTGMLVITGYPSVSSAVKAVKMGAIDYLSKPFTDDALKASVKEALRVKQDASMEKLLTETEEQRLIQKQEVIRVLDRTSKDTEFWQELMEKGSDALQEYRLTRPAKAAIISGDLEWIRKHVGDLSDEQLSFINKRLEREAW
jgi:DNA-binding response OmpR family regulator